MFSVFDRGFERQPNVTTFAISNIVPKVISTATVGGTVKLFSTEWTMSGVVDVVISMLCNEWFIPNLLFPLFP